MYSKIRGGNLILVNILKPYFTWNSRSIFINFHNNSSSNKK